MIEFLIVAVLVFVFWNPVVMNTIGPFIIWKTQKIPTDVKFCSIDESDFIASRNEIFLAYDLDLLQLKFKPIDSSLLEDSHTKSHFRLYWHPDIKVVAMVVTMESKAENITFLEFTQQYTDQTVLDVNNSIQPEAYPKIDFKNGFRFPKIKSAETLLKYHALLRSKVEPGADPVDFDVASGFAEVEDQIKRESDALLKMGIVTKEIDENGKRSLTLSGAFAMTFRSVPPGKNIWGYINENRAEKLIGEV